LRSDAARRALAGQIEALGEVIIRNSGAVRDIAHGVLNQFAELQDSMECARQRIDRAAAARAEPGKPAPFFRPRPGV
jgi:hypothetical protein